VGVRDIDIEKVIDYVRPMRDKHLDAPMVLNGPVGFASPDALPLVPFEHTSRVTMILDKIDAEPNVDISQIYTQLRNTDYANLPPYMVPAVAMNQTIRMQAVLIPRDDGTAFILKQFLFDRMPVSQARRLVVGTAMQLKYITPQPIMAKRVFHWLLERMGGLRLLWSQILPGEEEDHEDKAIDLGFDLIESAPPDVRSSSGLAQLRWIAEQTRRESSPLYKWPSALIEKAFRPLAQSGVLAKIRKEFPLNLMSLDPFLLRSVLPAVIRSLRDHGLLMLGEPNAGKTLVWVS